MVARVGVVTVLFKSGPVLPGFYASLAAQAGVELYLVVVGNDQDQASLDQCAELSEQAGIETTIIANDANLGVAAANNQGIAACLDKGVDLVLIANNDIEFAADTISTLAAALEAGYDAVSPLITYYDEPDRIWYGGGHLNALLARTQHVGQGARVDRADTTLRTTGYAPTCFMLVRPEVFASVGLMDPDYFVYYDDSDFVFRMGRLGLSLGYEPSAEVRHKVSSSTGGGTSPFAIYYTNRNRVVFIRKNLGPVRAALPLAYMLATKAIRLPFMQKAERRTTLSALRDGFAFDLRPKAPA